MRLTTLEPEFIRKTENGHTYVDCLERAQGILFLCPFCWQKNNGPVGTHSVIVYFADRGVTGEKYLWKVSGTWLGDLTLTPSIDLTRETDSPCWHGFITNGEAA